MLGTHETDVRVEFDPGTNVHHVTHDPECSWPVSTTVVLGLSELTETDPMEMLPLNGVVSPDALEHHVRSKAREAVLSFECYGHRVSVRADGRIEFAPVDGDETSDGDRRSGTSSSTETNP